MSQTAQKENLSSSTIQQYEDKLRELQNQRQNMFKRLRTVRKQQRYFKKQKKPQQSPNSSPRKMVKRDQYSSGKFTQETKKPSNLESMPDTNKEDYKKAGQVQSSLAERNKRLFGGLTSHLKKAKMVIESQEEMRKKKIEMEEKILEKKKSQSETMKVEKSRTLQEEFQQINKEKDTNAKEMLKYENLILQIKYNNYVNQLHPFIMTKSQPVVYWNPAKESDITQKLRTESQTLLKTKANSIKQIIGSYSEIFDLGKFIDKNEQEFLTNRLNRYYEEKYGFLITSSQPEILWKPAKFNDKLKQLHEKSKQFFAEQKNKLEEQLKLSSVKISDSHIDQHSDSEEQHSNKEKEEKSK